MELGISGVEEVLVVVVGMTSRVGSIMDVSGGTRAVIEYIEQ